MKGFAKKFYEITLELSILTLNCYVESQGLNLDVWGGNNFQAKADRGFLYLQSSYNLACSLQKIINFEDHYFFLTLCYSADKLKS